MYVIFDWQDHTTQVTLMKKKISNIETNERLWRHKIASKRQLNAIAARLKRKSDRK